MSYTFQSQAGQSGTGQSWGATLQTNPVMPTSLLPVEEIQGLSIQEMLADKNDHSVWVLNIMEQSGVMHGGSCYITVPRRQGNPIVVDVPRTWLAINLADKAPKRDILQSEGFMKAVSAGLLLPISTEQATAINSDPNAREEAARLRQVADVVKAAQASRGINRNVTLQVGVNNTQRDTQDHVLPQRAQANVMTSNQLSAPRQGHRKPLFQGRIGDAPMPTDTTRINMKAHLTSLASIDIDVEPETVPDDFKAYVTELNALDEMTAVKRLKGDALEVGATHLTYLVDNLVHPRIVAWAKGLISDNLTPPSN